jgi:transcriptional regulator with XRE-family HTH domain
MVPVGQSSVARWECGTNGPSDVHKTALARALDMDVSDLFPPAEELDQLPQIRH